MTDIKTHVNHRWYDDACGTAFALELVGERWSLLIMRELMFGGRRFSELRASLPGISANILTRRLEGLEAAGILTKRRLAPPASVQVYALTEWGLESEPLIQELGRWAVRSPAHDPTLPLSAVSIMMSFRTMYQRERGRLVDAPVAFSFGADRFVVTLGDEAFVVRSQEPADTEVATDPVTLGAIVYGGMPVADAVAAGTLSLAGDAALVDRFIACFELPPKWTAGAQ